MIGVGKETDGSNVGSEKLVADSIKAVSLDGGSLRFPWGEALGCSAGAESQRSGGALARKRMRNYEAWEDLKSETRLLGFQDIPVHSRTLAGRAVP